MQGRRCPKAAGLLAALCAALCAALPATSFAQDVAPDNADVYVTVTELADEVELIREVMGKRFDDTARLPVTGVTPIELYYQIETLVVASNRLAHEYADATLAYPPPPPDGAIEPADLLRQVERALADVRLVRAALGITESVLREDRDTPIAETGVFSVVLGANRQLNLLIGDEFDSADVHSRLVVATTLAAGILRSNGQAPPALPAVEPPRLPSDVYLELLESIDLLTDIGHRLSVPMLTLSSRRNVPIDVQSGEVYHLAQFLVADLQALARSVGATPAAIDFGPLPRHVFPSHTSRLAALLGSQIDAIDAIF